MTDLEKKIAEFVRDVTQVQPLSKSEVRSRLDALMQAHAQEYAIEHLEQVLESLPPVSYLNFRSVRPGKLANPQYVDLDVLRAALRSHKPKKG